MKSFANSIMNLRKNHNIRLNFIFQICFVLICSTFLFSCSGKSDGVAPGASLSEVIPGSNASSSDTTTPVDPSVTLSISSISDQVVYEGRTSTVNFSISYSGTETLTCSSANLSAVTSNSVLLPTTNIIFSGVYPNCSATLSLASGQEGLSSISIVVTDVIGVVASKTANANFNVTGYKISSVAMAPHKPIIPKNSNFSFTLMATYSDSSTKNITSNSTWSTSNTSLSSFTSAGILNNNYSGTSTTTSTITATYGSFSANTSATINPATITSLIVDVTSATMNINGTQQIKCYGLTSDGGNLDLTASCNWSSANSTIVSVDNSVDKGLVTAVNLGAATNITANYGSFTASSVISVDTSASVVSSSGLGLMANYYTGKAFNTLVNSRIDATVNFDWAASNNPAGNSDSFSVRWTGYFLAPETGTYTFYTQSDDGVKLMVNNTTVVSNWTDHATLENSGTISLVAGVKYPITLEFYENGGLAVMQLRYSSPTMAKQIIPRSLLFPY